MQENDEDTNKTAQQELHSLAGSANSQQRVPAFKAFLAKWKSISPGLEPSLQLDVIDLLNSAADKQNSEAIELVRVLAVDILSKHSNQVTIEEEVKLLYQLVADKPAPAEDWTAFRLQRALWWLHAWKRMDKEKDSNYNPADRPALNISPPAATGLPSGVDPAAIASPGLRNEYEQAIEQNRIKTVYYNQQYTLRRLEPEFKKIAAAWLANQYAKKPLAVAEITSLLTEWLPGSSEAVGIIASINQQTATEQ